MLNKYTNTWLNNGQDDLQTQQKLALLARHALVIQAEKALTVDDDVVAILR